MKLLTYPNVLLLEDRKVVPIDHIAVSHLRTVVRAEMLPLTVEIMADLITRSGVEFDAIAFQGMSGALLVPMLAVYMKKKIIFVRKDTADCHSSYMIEGAISGGTGRYIIVDDLIASGNTVRAIHNEYRKFWDRQDDLHAQPPVCAGIFLYCENGNGWMYQLQYEPNVSAEIWGCYVQDHIDELQRTGNYSFGETINRTTLRPFDPEATKSEIRAKLDRLMATRENTLQKITSPQCGYARAEGPRVQDLPMEPGTWPTGMGDVKAVQAPVVAVQYQCRVKPFCPAEIKGYAVADAKFTRQVIARTNRSIGKTTSFMRKTFPTR